MGVTVKIKPEKAGSTIRLFVPVKGVDRFTEGHRVSFGG